MYDATSSVTLLLRLFGLIEVFSYFHMIFRFTFYYFFV